jgi:diguanylate cyclase (GGDEF)-like protein
MQVRIPHILASGRSRFFLQFAVPAFAAVMIVAAVLGGMVLITARKADQLSTEKQQQLLATVLQQKIASTAHDQEGVTVWDDAVRYATARKPDSAWLDMNVGSWMRTYYGHDEAFVLQANNKPVFGMRDGRQVAPSTYEQHVGRIADPLIAKLRTAMLRPRAARGDGRTLSPGAIDVAVVGGRPAIVSAKPFISDTGHIVQRPGTEAVHVAVRYLDGEFVQELARSYALENARFEAHHPNTTQSSAPLRDADGHVLGYVAWQPFLPGTLLIKRLLPLSTTALLLIAGVLVVLLRHIRRSTLALEASEAQAHHLAFHDTLTGLPNRAMFDDRLGHELANARETKKAVALLYLDLDGFKNVNDTLGHPAGDELICAVASRLKQAVRSTELIARIGGDEFAIIQTGLRSPAEAEILCLRLLELVNEPFAIAGTQARVGVSVGIAFGPADAQDRAELARKADIALYEAKAAGKGRFLFFSKGMDATIRRRKLIETGLREAIDAGDQLEVYYQPLYSPESDNITGAEALLRWHHPKQGMISPSHFVPIAEQSGLIVKIGEWVLEQVCRDARDWTLGSVSVNVSAVQLRRPDFAERALTILERTGFSPERLEIEVTETSFIENAAGCEANLVRLRGAGVKVALDDFGTGYSSFSHLEALSVDRLKIDRSFVHGIGSDQEGSAIISAIMDLARASGLKVTAEGVETSEQRRFLSRVGCNTLQGFLLARPMPIREMNAVLAQEAERHGVK